MSPEPGPQGPQGLIPPKTRITNAWQLFWQRYYGQAPRKLFQVQRTILPGVRATIRTRRGR